MKVKATLFFEFEIKSFSSTSDKNEWCQIILSIGNLSTDCFIHGQNTKKLFTVVIVAV
jgi:hypothetical protein